MKNLGLFLTLISIGSSALAGELFNSGDRIVFMGDSITNIANDKQIRYPNVIREMLKFAGVDTIVIPAGVSGDNSDGMLTRMNEDVLSKKPQWMFLMCGVNDIWTTRLTQYKKNIAEMHKLCKTNNIKMFLIAPTVPRDNGEYQDKIIPYVAFIREYATRNNIPMADLNEWALAEMKKWDGATGNRWTMDGIHPTAYSHIEMAKVILTAAGYDTKKLQGAVDVMMRDDTEGPQVSAEINVSAMFFLSLMEQANQEQRTVNEVFEKMCKSLF